MEALNFQGCLPLSNQEIFFKTLVKRCGNKLVILGSTSPLMHELSKIDRSFLQSTIPESAFIPEGYDVAIQRHYRYLPAVSHRHDFIEVVYVLSGTCTNYIGSTPITLAQGDVCIIGKHTPHALGVFSDNCVSYNLMIRSSTFEKVFLGILPKHDVLSSFILKSLYSESDCSYLCFPTGKDSRILGYFNFIYEEYQQKRLYSRHMLNAMVSTFFIVLLRHYSALAVTSNPTRKNSVNRDISTILYYMQQNYNCVTLKILSEFFHYSERHLGRLIKEYTGESFTELLRRIRLNKASAYLTDSAMPISDIIAEVGYSDYGFFYKVFKEEFKITPAEYRRKYQN